MDETLVVAVAEFGRTPKINGFGGRDHWGHVFSFALAGAGISGGQVYGSSDKTGGYPASNRVQPQELTATIFHLLGIGHDATFRDRTGRPLPVSKGEPLWKLLGTQPATLRAGRSWRQTSTLVPPFDERQIVDTDFESGRAAIAARHRRAGQNVAGLADRCRGFARKASALHPARRLGERSQRASRGSGIGPDRRGHWRGFHFATSPRPCCRRKFAARGPGRFTFTVRACGGGSSSEFYREIFLKNFACRLVIFGFVDLKKDHRQQRVFASYDFQPAWCEDGQSRFDPFQVAATLRSQDGGAMETSRGIGVAVIVEKTTPGTLTISPADAAFIRLDDVEFSFNPRPRDETVTV